MHSQNLTLNGRGVLSREECKSLSRHLEALFLCVKDGEDETFIQKEKQKLLETGSAILETLGFSPFLLIMPKDFAYLLDQKVIDNDVVEMYWKNPLLIATQVRILVPGRFDFGFLVCGYNVENHKDGLKMDVMANAEDTVFEYLIPNDARVYAAQIVKGKIYISIQFPKNIGGLCPHVSYLIDSIPKKHRV